MVPKLKESTFYHEDNSILSGKLVSYVEIDILILMMPPSLEKLPKGGWDMILNFLRTKYIKMLYPRSLR